MVVTVKDRTQKIVIEAKTGLKVEEAKRPGLLHSITLRTSSSTVEGFLEWKSPHDGEAHHLPFNIVELNASGLTTMQRLPDWRVSRFNAGSACAVALTPQKAIAYEKFFLHVSNLGAAEITINHVRIIKEAK